ncbi:MAG: ATP-binding cassette domain-containing protein [Candidatus Woesearchaeota archaeon]
MADTILKVENLFKSYNKKEVLKCINLEIRPGEIFGIIGTSGSGKTTLLNSLIGFVRPDSGAILFKSPHLLSYDEKDTSSFRNVLEYHQTVKKNFGFAAQSPSVYKKLTLTENLGLFGTLYDLPRDARETNTKILLKLMGLFEFRDNLAENLSGGMIKRLDIACSLIHDPKILILDEPTADLDPYLRKQMWYLIRKINSKGTTIILSSHFLDELEELCDRIGILHDGKVESYGTPAQLKRIYQPKDEVHVCTTYHRYDILQEKLLSHKSELKIHDMRDVGTELIIRTKLPLETVQIVAKITSQIQDHIVDLRMNRPSMNEIFEDIIHSKEQNESKDN